MIYTKNIAQRNFGTQAKMNIIPENAKLIDRNNISGNTIIFGIDAIIGNEW